MARARSDKHTSCPDFCGFVSPEHWRNVGSFLRRAALHVSAQFWQPDSKSFCRFRAAAVPRDRQTGSRGISRSAYLYKLHFVSFVVRSATLKKPRNGGNFRDRMCNCNTVTRDAITITTWSGLRPDTPPTPHGPRKNSAYRSPFPNSSNRKSRGPAPPAWVPIL